MAKKEKYNSKHLIEEYIDSIAATDEQIQFLIEQFKDEDCVIGIHNTNIHYEPFFETGLRNYTSMDKETKDLSNTVMYSDVLLPLLMYPNGDGKKRGKTAIILKIPKKVFSKEQGIFETLPNNTYGIPTQFIVGAFMDGEIVLNDQYSREYNNENAIICDDRERTNFDRISQIRDFQKAYKKNIKKENVGLKYKILNLINRIKNRKTQEALPIGKNTSISQKNNREDFIEVVQNGIKKDGIEEVALNNLAQSIEEKTTETKKERCD